MRMRVRVIFLPETAKSTINSTLNTRIKIMMGTKVFFCKIVFFFQQLMFHRNSFVK